MDLEKPQEFIKIYQGYQQLKFDLETVTQYHRHVSYQLFFP
jgi:hypothetical protein